MTAPHGFDEYASKYSSIIQAQLGASGEQHDYFVQLKADLAHRELSDIDARAVLDFGCGIGLSTQALSRAFPKAAVLGCDESLASVDVARSRSSSPQLVFVQVDDAILPFADASFDIVFAACVFHHIAEHHRRHWANELARVVRPGGAVILFEHNPYNPLTVRVVRHIPFDEGVVLLRGCQTEALLASTGLDVSAAAYYFFFPRVLAPLRLLERWMRWLPLGAQYYVVARRGEDSLKATREK